MHTGRLDDQVKLNGQLVNPGEVEAVLEQHGIVHKAVVLPNEHKTTLIAYVEVPDLSGFLLKFNENDYYCDKVVVERLWTFLKQSIPQYMMPYTYVCCYSLPRLPSGKVNKLHLPSSLELQAAVPESDQFQPSNSTEAAIKSIFMSLLHISCIK